MKLFCLEVDCTGQVVKKKKKHNSKRYKGHYFQNESFWRFYYFCTYNYGYQN